VAGIVILTMLINGSIVGLMVKFFGLSTDQSAKKKVLINFLQESKDEIERYLDELRKEFKEIEVDWD
jgi:uncharacterized membrane-anchored protein YhcB (DUF1043 family)